MIDFQVMKSSWRKRIQLALGLLLVAATLRVALIFYERNQPVQTRKPPERQSSYTITDDDYVTPPKVFPYDLKSANKELSGKIVWVRAGNQLPYYSYSAATRHVTLGHQVGLLAPLERLEIKDFVLQNSPRSPKQRQIMAIFDKVGDHVQYGTPVGIEEQGSYTFYVNDAFFMKDPHELYKHWPAEVWNAIDHRQAKPGMNELQAGFALGASVAAGSGDYGNRRMEYSNAGKPVTVTFSDNKAVSVEQGTGQ
jgi:hypothetical protein